MISSASFSLWDRQPLVRQMAECNPMSGNPLKSRADLQDAVMALFRPLQPWYSEGSARLRLSVSAAHYDDTAAEMEAFVRPLWGIVPLVTGNYSFPETKLFTEGLAHGMDPNHQEFWGEPDDFDQRLVETAGIALALLLAPETFWAPLPEPAKDKVERWLLQINEREVPDNNWLFFRVLVNLGLRNVGRQWSEEAVRAALERIETYYLGDGYYRDGKWGHRDYYLPMALHFYGLMIAKCAGDVFPEYAGRYRERARLFAQDFQHWFADDGAAVPYGRSLTYRFAEGAFWAACAFADEEVLPWGRVKGLLLRHLRWWSKMPIADRDGVLSVGYAYPNLLMSESYNAPGSPYWGLKIFLVLALDESHPFWAAEEEPPEALPGGRVFAPSAGFAMRRAPGDAVMLTGGQDGREHRLHDAKYARFAYSSAFGFSVQCDMTSPDRPDCSAVDSGIAISRDGRTYISRAVITEEGADRGMVWGVWQPDDRLRIESWMDFAGEGWHVRLHRIDTMDRLFLSESGFSVDRTGEDKPGFGDGLSAVTGCARVATPTQTTAIVDLSSARAGEIIRAAPNTNIRFPRTLFPRLFGELPAGEHFIATAVYGVTKRVDTLPPVSVPDTIRAFCAENGVKLQD
ncbi:DUF2264 domain-containing protein [Martelella mediterranea]|uniref:DUF2264 domain-containing protein n=1 Tax=Martelella mediterranea TaxID=293089 RepID=A0A4R3NMD2_9HYPH|nr:DUF2264 domain-containing protein [Martelella mediterranea]TCT31737.1 hypothetical protein EDC90_10407 [Martelella mediterranea]